MAKIYYVDANGGSDSNSGLSAGSAFKSLAQVNKLNLQPGDQVLFQRGDTFSGSLTPKADGTAGAPITFGSYGAGSDPVLKGQVTVQVDHVTLKDLVVLPSQCSAPIEDLNWSPVQLGTEAARTDFTNENQSITGSVEVAKLGDQAAKVAAHNKNVATILDECKTVKLNGLDYRETLKFSDPGVPEADSALYYSRDGQYAQDSLVLIKSTEQYAVMVSFMSATSLQDATFNKVATSIMDTVLAQLP